MGPEALVAAAATILGFLTWSHQQRQTVINDRFNSVKKRLEEVEIRVNEFPAVYALKTDLNTGLTEIKDRLNHINDKLDQLILSKINEKN
jgi:tetrahydromethanopterin S-methyltransferase subunit G|tara:strand:+ start:385 stop:654 length:270 start_codon:yes stop_codon:yes gene_type:complete